MKPERPFFLSAEDNDTISFSLEDSAPFYPMDMEEEHLKEAFLALSKGELEAIVSEDHGGIIGFAFKGIAEDVSTVLSLHYIQRKED